MYLSYLLTKPNDSDCVITVMARYTEKGIWINHIHIKKKKKKERKVSQWPSSGTVGGSHLSSCMGKRTQWP